MKVGLSDQEHKPIAVHLSNPEVVNKSGMLSEGLIETSDKMTEVDLNEG
jgi:hypothetical protein